MVVKIAVIGGCGSMGKWMINFLRKKGEVDVTVADPDEIEGAKLVRTMGIKYEKDNKKAVAESDIAIVSVSVENAPEVIMEVAPFMKDGALLVDITSIKTEVVSTMLKHAPQHVELISIHPMVGPRVKDIKDQIVVLIRVRSEKWFDKVKRFLEDGGAEIVETSVEDHDRMMSIVQGLTHFTGMVFTGVIREMCVNIKHSKKFSSPVYNALLPLMYRVICQNPELYAQLQVHNLYVSIMQEVFISQAVKLNECTKNKNTGEIVRQISSSCRHFMYTESWTALLSMSDRVVSTIQREKNILENLIGKKVCLENIQTGKIHLGVLKSVSANTIELEESNKKL